MTEASKINFCRHEKKDTLDLPKQAATPKFGIHVVLTTEPSPVTVCNTEPSWKRQNNTGFKSRYICISTEDRVSHCWLMFEICKAWFYFKESQLLQNSFTCRDQMFSNPPIPPETNARPLEQNERDFTAVMCPFSTKIHFALSCCK